MQHVMLMNSNLSLIPRYHSPLLAKRFLALVLTKPPRPSIDTLCPGGLVSVYQTCTQEPFLVLCQHGTWRSLKYLPTFCCRHHPCTLYEEQPRH